MCCFFVHLTHSVIIIANLILVKGKLIESEAAVRIVLFLIDLRITLILFSVILNLVEFKGELIFFESMVFKNLLTAQS